MAVDVSAPSEYDVLVHVGPGTLAGRYMRLFWQPVYRAKDLAPGRAIPLRIMGEDLTLYRGEGGAPHVVAFRCAHRGTQLSVGWVEDDCIRCRYHGWKYDQTGQCVEQPGEDPVAAQRVRIQAYPTREYVGLVFAYLGPGDPPPFRRLPDLEQPGVIVVDPPEYVPCNFWNRLDNDGAHLAWTHRSTALRSGQLNYLDPREETFEETDYGFTSTVHSPGRPPSRSHFNMPINRHWRAKVRSRSHMSEDLFECKFTWHMPVDDEHYVAFDVTLTPLTGEAATAYAEERANEQEPEAETRWEIAKAVLAGKMTIEDMPDEVSYYNMNAIEDYTVQTGQGAIPDRSSEHLGRNDAPVIFKRNLWLRELRALAEGRPLKEWKIPEQPFHTL